MRIVHDSKRFSEDLDFDNFNLSANDFSEVAKIIQQGLEREGYQVETQQVINNAFHCYIKFSALLYKNSLNPHLEEKILIQLDTEPRKFSFTPKKVFLNKFDVFWPINSTPLSLLLSQKFYAVLNRKRNKRRDFYDIVNILGRGVLPNYDYLKQKVNIWQLA